MFYSVILGWAAEVCRVEWRQWHRAKQGHGERERCEDMTACLLILTFLNSGNWGQLLPVLLETSECISEWCRENVKPIIAMGPCDSAQPSASPAQCIHIQILGPDAALGPVRMGWLLGLAEKIHITYFYPQLDAWSLQCSDLFSLHTWHMYICHTCSTLDCVNDDHHLPVKVCATKCPQLPGPTDCPPAPSPQHSTSHHSLGWHCAVSVWPLQRCEIEALSWTEINIGRVKTCRTEGDNLVMGRQRCVGELSTF